MGIVRGKRVAIVGAGPAGLAAAAHLARRGISVRVYEKADLPGGRSGCDPVGGYRFDRGAEFVTSFYPRTLRMIDNHGLTDRLSELHLEGDILADSRRHPLPVTPALLLRTPLLGWRTKLRILALGPRLLWWRLCCRWTDMERGAAWDDRSALEYIGTLLGEEYVRFLLGPTLESFVLSPAGETSRVLAMTQAHEAVTARYFCLHGGMAKLWEVVAAGLPVGYGMEVRALAVGTDRVTLLLPGGEESADAAVIAIPGPEAAGLLPPDHPEREFAARSRYSSVVKLHACLGRPMSDVRPVCAAGIGNRTLAGVGTLEAKGSGQVPEGRGSLHAWTGPALGRELIDASDDAARDRLCREAETLLGRSLPEFDRSSIVRLRCGLPVFFPGWPRLLRERRRSLVPARVTLAGDYLASPSMEGAIRTGQEAAARVVRFLGG